MSELPFSCPTCHTRLKREWGRCGDPIMWCAQCQMGWLPGTRAFDLLLEAQDQKVEAQVYLFQTWDL